MKPKQAITAALLLISAVAYCQTDHPVNFLDIQNSKLKETFKRKEKVRVKVDNVNRFLYKVSTEKTETDFHMTVPAILSGIKLPAFLTTQMPTVGASQAPMLYTATSKSAADW